MALPAIAGAFTKGLLGAGARGAATGGARAMAGQAAKGAAKQGFKKFAQGMTGRTSDAYKARVDGINPETGEYLTPEERKARFKGFATATKPGSQKLLSGGPTQTVAALPPAGGVGADSTSDTQTRTVNHLEKIQMYLEKLLGIEESALARLQDRILDTAKEDQRDAAASEEAGMEAKKDKPKKTNPIVQGMKKKAQGIFGLLMDLGMKFVGFKILDWLSNPENEEKVQKIVEFFQGVVGFITTVGGFLGDAFNFSVDVITQGIEGIKFMAGKVKDFFSFEWLDIDALLEPLQPVMEFFTITIPEAFGGFIDGLANVVDAMDKLPEQFSGIVEKIASGFLGFLGLGPTDTQDFQPPEKDTPVPDNGFLNSDPDPKPTQPEEDKRTEQQQAVDDNAKTMAAINNPFRKGGRITGGTHGQGGVDINAEGGEYVLNRRAVAAIGGSVLDRLNFGMYPAVGKSTGNGKYAAGGSIKHPYLEKLGDANIRKASSPMGYCVTGSLNTMSRSGVPNPAATGMDEGNNPRGAIVQLMKSFGWKSMGGKSTQLNSPYGKVRTGVYSRNEYSSLVDKGKVPSGALVFQTKYDSWNGTAPGSSGYDMAIAQKGGKEHWNGQPMPKFVYGSLTKKIVVLTPDGKQGDGSDVDMTPSADGYTAPVSPSGSTNNSSSDSTTTEAKPKLSKEALILNAANSLAEMMGGKAVNTEDILSNLQNENNRVTGEQESAAETTTETVNLDQSGSFQTGMDVDYDVPSLGFNFPPFYQAFFPLNP